MTSRAWTPSPLLQATVVSISLTTALRELGKITATGGNHTKLSLHLPPQPLLLNPHGWVFLLFVRASLSSHTFHFLTGINRKKSCRRGLWKLGFRAIDVGYWCWMYYQWEKTFFVQFLKLLIKKKILAYFDKYNSNWDLPSARDDGTPWGSPPRHEGPI